VAARVRRKLMDFMIGVVIKVGKWWVSCSAIKERAPLNSRLDWRREELYKAARRLVTQRSDDEGKKRTAVWWPAAVYGVSKNLYALLLAAKSFLQPDTYT